VDASMAKCILLPAMGQNYDSDTLKRVKHAHLLDVHHRRTRTLIENCPAHGEHSLLFALPVKQHSSLVLHGEAGTPWQFQWRMKETSPLPRTQTLAPESPTLQALAKKVAAGEGTEAFWQMQIQQGTPMVEPVDAD